MDIRPIIEDLEYLKSVYGDCPAGEALDILKIDALRRIAKTLESNANQAQAKRNITYHDFFEEFNKISLVYHAYASALDEVFIVDQEGNLKANLNSEFRVWAFRASSFDPSELALMEQLADTPPELRGEIDNG